MYGWAYTIHAYMTLDIMAIKVSAVYVQRGAFAQLAYFDLGLYVV